MKIKTIGGFTLVEILLGLAITAIIGVSIYNIFWVSLKLDDKMRHLHDNYMEILMADQVLTRDLENAVSLDYSVSYPDASIFNGQRTEMSFLTQTPKGIKHVRYYSDVEAGAATTKLMIGRVTNPGDSKGPLPVEFLLRQESSLADWLNETSNDTSVQIVSAGLKKGSFNCGYAVFVKDLHTSGEKAIIYKDSWDDKGLPMAVSCSFILYDSQNIQKDLEFKRDIFLAPVGIYHHEQ